MNRANKECVVVVIICLVIAIGIGLMRIYPPEGFEQERNTGKEHIYKNPHIVEIPIPAER